MPFYDFPQVPIEEDVWTDDWAWIEVGMAIPEAEVLRRKDCVTFRPSPQTLWPLR